MEPVANSPLLCAQVPESHCLLRRKVNHDESIDSSLPGILQHPLISVTQQRVVVSHEEHGGLETPLAGGADHVQHHRDCDTILQGLGIGLLDGRAICNWVCEWDTKFDDI